MSNLVTVRDNHLTCKGVHVVQYGDTQEQLMSLLQQGYQLTYYLENPPEEGKLTVSQPNPEDDSRTKGVDVWGHLELSLSLSSDQIPADLTDYYNVLYPPDFNGPRGNPNTFPPEGIAIMQNILTAYTTLLREYELNPPETTPDTTVTQSPADNIHADPGLPGLYGPQPRFIINTNTDYLALVPTKLIALTVFPDLPLEEIPTDITEYFAKFFPNQSLTETYSDEQIAQLQGALDSFIASRKADTTTDPSYNLEYNSDPKNTTITLPAGRVVKLSDDILLTLSLSDEQLDLSQPYLLRISDYINPETGRLEDLPIPLIAFKNDDSADITVTAPTPETRKGYKLVPVAEGEDSTIPGYKLVLVDLTEEEIAVFNELPHGDISFDLLTDEQKALILKAAQSYTDSLKEKETDATDITVTDTTNNVTAQNADPGLCGPQPAIVFDPKYAKQMEDQFKNGKFRQSGYGRGQAFFRFIYDSDEAITPSGYELVRTESWSGPDCTDEQIADIARYIIQNDFYGEQQKALMLEAVDAFLANPKKAQSIFDLTFTSTMDAETEAITSVQVASAEDGGWRTIGTLNNPDGIDWKYQAGNLTGSGTASVVWHAQELGALGVWTDGTDNWTAVDGWFDTNWTMLGCGDFDGDGKDSVLMSLNGGLFYSVDLDGTLTSLGGLNWSGWEFSAVGDFAGDGKDDIVLFHKELGTVVLLADGNADAFERLGQLDASDWSVTGAGDFDADGKDDLLVRQNSTGIAGAYASADMSKWSTVSSDYLLA